MADRPGYLGVDLGTSGLKLCLVDDTGGIVAEAEASYDVEGTEAGHAEIDPGQWQGALVATGERLAADLATRGRDVQVAAIGWSGQMHGTVLESQSPDQDRPRAILWADQRAASVLDRWRRLPAPDRARLGNPLAPGMAGPILTAVASEHPGRVTTYTAPKDWLRRRLTGDVVTERSDASASLLWDIVGDTWSTAAVRLAGLDPTGLPDVVDSAAVVGHTRWPSLDQPVPVVAGGADTACALTALRHSFSAGAKPQRDQVATIVNLGTGIQLLRTEATPAARTDPTTHIYANCQAGWYEMFAIQNGGLALTWAQDVLGLGRGAMVAEASRAPAGSRGVRFLPFLAGERGALAMPTSTAAWVGLTRAASRADLARSVLEGYAFTVRRGLELLGADDGPLIVSGGGARDPWLLDLLAAVLGRAYSHVALRSASAVGAAVLAARGVGASLRVAAEVIEVPGRRSDRLDEAYADWVTALPQADRPEPEP